MWSYFCRSLDNAIVYLGKESLLGTGCVERVTSGKARRTNVGYYEHGDEKRCVQLKIDLHVPDPLCAWMILQRMVLFPPGENQEVVFIISVESITYVQHALSVTQHNRVSESTSPYANSGRGPELSLHPFLPNSQSYQDQNSFAHSRTKDLSRATPRTPALVVM
jgi:hypothetical protein